MDPHTSDPSELAALPVFDGYPCLVTALLGGLYHFIVVPGDLGPAELLDLARHQHLANRLRTCLVLGPDIALYFRDDGEAMAAPPRCSHPIADRLLSAEEFPLTEELLDRQRRLRAFVAGSHARNGGGFLVDRMRGRPATREDLVRLSKPDVDGVPVGLARCEICAGYRGDYIPSHEPSLVATVFCRCENHNRCARCLLPLHEHRLEAAYYDESRRGVWHVPAFCGLSHRCPPIAEE
ncbi:MAG: hypothetical protein M3O91_11295 [Chloroflexota bacterium]|nr:hypothetical protein [Chloroflexota bacterium]